MASLSDNPDTALAASGDLPQADPAAGGAAAAANTPRLVTRGESPLSHLPHPEGNAQAAFTDWLNFTYRVRDGKDPVKEFWRALEQAVGSAFGIMQERPGKTLHGYQRSFLFERGGVMFAVGGQSNTAFLSIPGEGCALVASWPRLTEVFHGGFDARITRWDGAVDDYEGRHSVNDAVALYRAHQFNSNGRHPSSSVAGNWIEPDGSGRTLYVGKGKNGKLARIYEKGMELGLKWSPWVRWEVQLRNIDRIIPWEVLTEPGRYVAGAYPALSWVSEDASRIATLRRQDTISYDNLVHYGSVAYGPLLNTMLAREGTAERVLAMLIRPGVPKRLALTQYLQVYREQPE